jgi:hypothetical protein
MKRQASKHRGRWVWACVALLVLGGCGGGDGGNPSRPVELTVDELTARGWSRFTAGDFSGALADFDTAIGRDATHGPAHVGRGWTRLQLATTTATAADAVASFGTAIGLGASGPEVRAGRAAASLAVGGGSLDQAIADAVAARQASPQFQFTHRPSFDHRDLRLIEAFAQVGRNDLASALAAADAIEPSGIDAGNAASWTVDGQTYGSFGAAVLAHLHKLSLAHAG